MTTALPVLWTPAQQAWLQAMGHTVLHDTALAAQLEAVAAADASAAVMAGSTPERSVAPVVSRPVAVRQAPTAPSAAPDRPASPVPGHSPPMAPVALQDMPVAPRTGAARQPSVRLPDRLQMALLRASGCNPNDASTQVLMESWPLDTLRGNPAAKRALWPMLRALRRKGGA